MSLSRKHFQALADIVRDAYANADSYRPHGGNWEGYATARTDAVASIAQALADFCGQHNPNFDRARFLDACQPKPVKE